MSKIFSLKNYKLLLREIKEYLNKRRNIFCSGIRRKTPYG